MARTPDSVARDVAGLAQAERFDQIRDRFAQQLRPIVSREALQTGWDSEIARHGRVTSIGPPASDPAQGGTVTVRIPVTCERGAFTLLVTITDSDQLAGLQVASISAAAPVAAWQPPDYADPTAFDEHDVLLGTRELAVGATVSIPTHPASVPAVVLLAGSGPQDRDETLGRTKLFKDIAWGLASRGIAVLRFDKVTLAHPEAVRANPDFTLADEYTPQTIAGVRLLWEQPGIDPERVFVLGHSLGGTIAPQIAQAEPAIAGVILLAGSAEPFHRSLLRQARYVASLNPDTAPASELAIQKLARQTDLVDDPELSPATPAGDLPFGLAPAYWLALRNYEPEQVAAELDRPILVLQGGRDYQVTIADDLRRWESTLVARPDVTIRVYDTDNHFFFTGTGPSSPADYESPEHLDPRVITDISSWLTSTGPRAPHGPRSDSTPGARRTQKVPTNGPERGADPSSERP